MDDENEERIVLNAREQFRKYVARNYRVALGCEAEDVSKWTVSSRVREKASGARSIRTALDVFKTSSSKHKDSSWTRIESPTFEIDSKYMDIIERNHCEIVRGVISHCQSYVTHLKEINKHRYCFEVITHHRFYRKNVRISYETGNRIQLCWRHVIRD